MLSDWIVFWAKNNERPVMSPDMLYLAMKQIKMARNRRRFKKGKK